MMTPVVLNCLEKLSRESTLDGEALAALHMLQKQLAKEGTSLVELVNSGDHNSEVDRTFRERQEAISDLLVTGKKVAEYRNENALQARRIAELEVELAKARLKIESLEEKARKEKEIHREKIKEVKKTVSVKQPKMAKPQINGDEQPNTAKNKSKRCGWSAEQFAWAIRKSVSINGDLKTADRTGRNDPEDVIEFNETFNEQLDFVECGGWRAKTNSIRDWNTEELILEQPPEVLEALREKGWDGKPSTKQGKLKGAEKI